MEDDLRIALPEPVLTHAEARRFVGTRAFYPASVGLDQTLEALTGQSHAAMPQIDAVADRVNDATTGLMLGMFSREDGFEYVPGVEVLPTSDESALPNGWVAVDLQSGRYLTFTTPLEDMRKTVYTVWFEWLPGSPYELAAGGDLLDYIERYDDRFDPETGGGVCEVVFPIRD